MEKCILLILIQKYRNWNIQIRTIIPFYTCILRQPEYKTKSRHRILKGLTLHSALQTHTHTRTHTHTHTNKDWINIQPLDRTDSVNDLFLTDY
jgi:hypothetical protein